MKSLKIISLLLAAMMCLPLLASCASPKGPGSDTRPPSSQYADLNNFMSADYKGEDFTFLFLQQPVIGTGKDYYGGNYLDSETFEGLTVEDKVYERNLAIEDKYNVNINQRIEDVNKSGDPITILQTFAMAGDYSFDAIYGWGHKMGACIVQNLFADIKTLPNVDLTQEYWSPSAMEDLTVNGKLYMTISDISMNKLEWGGLIFFNKQIVEDYGLEAKVGNFYDLVNEGQWTLDKFFEAVTSVSTDVDGSGSIDNNDVYGLIDGEASGRSLGIACGIELTQKQENGGYKVSYYSTANVDLARKINDVYTDSRYVRNYEHLGENASIPDGKDEWEYYRSFFSSGHALFSTGTAQITGEFREMEDPYGILPFPKKDENQENYISTIDYCASIFAIPSTYRQDVTTASPERTGLILETLSFMSNKVVLPTYYETLLKGQRLSDENDQMMLDIVRNNIRYIFAEMMGTEALLEIRKNCEEMFKSPGSAASLYKGKEAIMNRALQNFYTEILKLDAQSK